MLDENGMDDLIVFAPVRSWGLQSSSERRHWGVFLIFGGQTTASLFPLCTSSTPSLSPSVCFFLVCLYFLVRTLRSASTQAHSLSKFVLQALINNAEEAVKAAAVLEAAKASASDALDLLVEGGAGVGYKEEGTGLTALHYACRCVHETVRVGLVALLLLKQELFLNTIRRGQIRLCSFGILLAFVNVRGN